LITLSKTPMCGCRQIGIARAEFDDAASEASSDASEERSEPAEAPSDAPEARSEPAEAPSEAPEARSGAPEVRSEVLETPGLGSSPCGAASMPDWFRFMRAALPGGSCKRAEPGPGCPSKQGLLPCPELETRAPHAARARPDRAGV